MDIKKLGRRATCELSFNGKNVTQALREYMETVTFTDVASGSSDSISIQLSNVDLQWNKDWYPNKGDVIEGGIRFNNWDKPGDVFRLQYGTFILDEIRLNGSPRTADFGGMAIPKNSSFTTRQRTRTWENVTVKRIAEEIAGRYGLKLGFDADDDAIESLEQTNRTDSDFLYNTVKDYGLKMKVYNKSIAIFDAGRLEEKPPVATIGLRDWIGSDWDYTDTLEGTYTGAIAKYKAGDDSTEEYDVKVGKANEEDPNHRILYINSKFDSEAEAIKKAMSKVNEENEKMTKLSGEIWCNTKICSGVTVQVRGMGHIDGKYFVEKVTTKTGNGGTTQSIDMHKCYERLKTGGGSHGSEERPNRPRFESCGCGWND